MATSNSYRMAPAITDYDVGHILGQGGFAHVYRAHHRFTGKEFAIKVMDKKKLAVTRMEDRIMEEIKIHARLDSPHIVQLFDCFEDDDHIYMVMELCEKGNMYRYLKKVGQFSEHDAGVITYQLLLALKHLHDRGVVHRDIKLSNILIGACE